MAERVYSFAKAKAEVADNFRNTEVRFNVPDAPTGETEDQKFDSFVKGVRSTGISAVTAYALFASAYALEVQKEAKDLTKEEGVTPENIQDKLSATTIERALRGSGTGTTRKPSGKLKAKAVLDDMKAERARLASENADPAILKYFDERIAKLEAAEAEAKAAEPAKTEAETKPAPKAGKGNK